MNIVTVENLSFIRNKTTILKNINWTVQENENWVILGPNGSGKSSLVSMLTAYEWPTEGSVKIKNNIYGSCQAGEIRKKIGLFEPSITDQILLHHPLITALEVICTGMDASIGMYHEYEETTKDRARALLKNTFKHSGFHIDESRSYSILSSGEKRKILFLRILISQPELIIFDEPYESLDIPSRSMLESIFNNYIDLSRIPSITVLHRIEEIPLYATHVLMLKNGEVFSYGKIDDLINSKILSDLYDTDLLIEKRLKRFVCILNIS